MTSPDRTIPGNMPASPGERPCCMLTANPVPAGLGTIDSVYDLSDKLDHHYGAKKLDYVLKKEISGLIYTCALGFFDLGHSRDTTDLTWFYFNWIRRKQKNKAGDTFQVLANAQGTVTIKRDIPPNDQIMVARSICYDESVFHEIMTFWFPVLGGHASSFSPEDLVSNLAGTYIAERVIKAFAAGNYGGDFDKAATIELKLLLMTVQALPKNRAVDAFNKVKGRWFIGDPFQDVLYLKRRNFNVSPVVPWLVLDDPACTPLTLPPDYITQFPANIKTYYEIEFNIPSASFGTPPVNIQTIMGGPTLKTSEFNREIDKIKAFAKQPESAGGYGPDFDKP